MFGWLKGKTQEKQSGWGISDHARQVVAAASPVLELNLVLCRSVDNFEVILASERVRGYIVGFFDGAAQAGGVEFSSDKQFFTYLGLGHELVLQKDLDDPITFAMESIALQGSEAFSEGQILGGTDYFNWMSDRQQQPIGLLRLFHEVS